MRKYIIKRLLLSLATIFVLITLTFFLLKAIPGSPFDPSKMSAQAYDKLMTYYGLDQPILTQYFRYMGNLLKGDLGYTISGSRSISTIIAQSLPRSMTLGLTALIFALVFGLTLGVISALNRGKTVDRFIIFVVVALVSVPSFVIASLFQYFFCFKLRLFPIIAVEYSFRSYFIPSLCLCLGTVASLSRLMRTSMLEVVSADYVKTAKSKGLSKSKIILSHQMRNAMLPIITVLGPTTAFLLTGTFVIERIFSINGLGKYFVDSISTAEVGMTMALTIVFGTFLIACNFVVDILYGIVDPRIRIY